jgi:hypothetical protein
MWLPTFLQRGIHFFGERTEVLSIILYSSIVSICLSSEGARAVVEEDLLSVRELV